MSKLRITEFKCPQCGATGEYKVWDSINVDLNPELKEGLLSGELYDWKCPGCGQEYQLPYGTIYHDMKRNYLILYSPEPGKEDRYSPMQKEIASLFGHGYTVRSVYGYPNLKEKITILDEGLDDITIEVIKLTLKDKVLPEWKGDNKKLYLCGVNKNQVSGELESFDIIFVNNALQKSAIGTYDMALYQQMHDVVQQGSGIDLEGNTCVDSEWVISKLGLSSEDK